MDSHHPKKKKTLDTTRTLLRAAHFKHCQHFIKPSMCNLHYTCWKLHQGHKMPLRIHFLYGLGMRMRAIPPAPTVWVALCNELSLLPTDLMSLWKYITWIPFPTPSLSSAQLCIPLNRSLEMDYGFPLRKLPHMTSYLCFPTGLICNTESIIAPTIRHDELRDLPTVFPQAENNMSIHQPLSAYLSSITVIRNSLVNKQIHK